MNIDFEPNFSSLCHSAISYSYRNLVAISRVDPALHASLYRRWTNMKTWSLDFEQMDLWGGSQRLIIHGKICSSKAGVQRRCPGVHRHYSALSRAYKATYSHHINDEFVSSQRPVHVDESSRADISKLLSWYGLSTRCSLHPLVALSPVSPCLLRHRLFIKGPIFCCPSTYLVHQR